MIAQDGIAQHVHPMISQKITLLVRECATDAKEVKRVLTDYVKSKLKQNCPDQLNSSYFPTTENICHLFYLAKHA